MNDRKKSKKTFFVVGILVIFTLLLSNVVIIFSQEPAIGRYFYGEKDITVEMSAEDTKIIKNIINFKSISKIEPICGFDEDVSVKIGTRTFCIACDSCGVLCINDEDKFLYLSEEENEILRSILEKYGFEFPCI